MENINIEISFDKERNTWTLTADKRPEIIKCDEYTMTYIQKEIIDSNIDLKIKCEEMHAKKHIEAFKEPYLPDFLEEHNGVIRIDKCYETGRDVTDKWNEWIKNNVSGKVLVFGDLSDCQNVSHYKKLKNK